MKGYPRRFKRAVVAALMAVWSSGLLLLPTTLLTRLDWMPPWRLTAEQRIPVAGLHALAGLVMALLLGAVWTVHVRGGWRRHRARRSGGLLAGSLLVLALSAVGIAYVTDEGVAQWVGLTHAAVGTLVLACFLVHERRHRHRRGRRLRLG